MGRSRGHGGKSSRNGRHHGPRTGHSKSQSPPPGSPALELRLIAEPEFHEAVSGRGCPAKILQDDGTDSPGLQLSLAKWGDLDMLLSWYKAGAAQDSSAYIVFASELQKEHREEVHRLAERMGLESVSQGVGSGRYISVGQKGFTPAKEDLSEEQQIKADGLYQYAKDAGMTVSRDEIAEQISSGQLSGELQSLWEERAAQQEAVSRLNAAASRGDTKELQEAIAASQGVVKAGVYELRNRLAPLHCAAAHGHADALQALIDAGAPLEATDGFGNTPLQAARKFEQQDTEAVLLRAGAKDREGEKTFGKDVSLPSKGDGASAKDSKVAGFTGISMEQAVGAKPFVPLPNKGAGAMTSLDKAVDAKPFFPQGIEDANKGTGQVVDTDVAKRGAELGWEGAAKEKRAKMGAEEPLEQKQVSEDAVAGSFPSGGTLPETQFPPLPSAAAEGDKSQDKKADEAEPLQADDTYAAVASKGVEEAEQPAQTSPESHSNARTATPKPEGQQGAGAEGDKGAAGQEARGSNAESGTPPVISLSQLKVPGGGGLDLSLSETMDQLSRREGDSGPPDLRGDKRAATRGRPGASALALGRRIIEHANADRRRSMPAGSSRKDPQNVEAEKKVDISKAPKPKVPRRKGEDDVQKRNNRVQDWVNGQEGSLENDLVPELPDIAALDPPTVSSSAAVESGKKPQEGSASYAAVVQQPPAASGDDTPAEPSQANPGQSEQQRKEQEHPQQSASEEKDLRGLEGGYQEPLHPPVVAPSVNKAVPAVVGGAAVASEGEPANGQEDVSGPKGKKPHGTKAGAEKPRTLNVGFKEPSQPPTVVGQNDGKVASIPAVVGGRRVPGMQPTESMGKDTFISAPDLAGDPRTATWGKPAKPVYLPRYKPAANEEPNQEYAAGSKEHSSQPPAAASSKVADNPGVVGGTAAGPDASSSRTGTESKETAYSARPGSQGQEASAAADAPAGKVQPSTQETERTPAFAEEAPAVHPPSPRAAKEAKAAETEAGKQLEEKVASKGLPAQSNAATAAVKSLGAAGSAVGPNKEGSLGPKGLGPGLPAARPSTTKQGARTSNPAASSSLKGGDSLVYPPPKSVFAGKNPAASGQLDTEPSSDKCEASGSGSRPSGRVTERAPSTSEIEPASPSAPSRAKAVDNDWEDDEESLLETMINWAQANQVWVYGGLAIAAVATGAGVVASSWRK